MVNATSTCLALTPWVPPVSHQISSPVKHCLAIPRADKFIDEEREFSHRPSNKSEDLGYDQQGRVIQQTSKGFIIDFYG